jgi:hypothetical protein
MLMDMTSAKASSRGKQRKCSCKISGSQGDEFEDGCLRVVASCSLVEVYRSFRGACCLHHQGDESDGGSKEHL